MKSKIAKILGIGLTAGLVFGLIGAVFAAPVAADLMKWGIVNTPSHEDYEILPGADIYDYAVGGANGDIVYAVGEINPISGMFTITGGTFDLTATSDPAVAAVTLSATGTSSGLSGDYVGTATIGDVLSGLYGDVSFTATVTPTTATLNGYVYVTGAPQEALLAAVVAGTPDAIMPGSACVDNWALEWNTAP